MMQRLFLSIVDIWWVTFTLIISLLYLLCSAVFLLFTDTRLLLHSGDDEDITASPSSLRKFPSYITLARRSIPLCIDNGFKKFHVWSYSIAYFFVGEKSETVRIGGRASVTNSDVIDEREIIFVRHGESEWNRIFNRKFSLKFFLRLISGVIMEIILGLRWDSWFIDSPLSYLGINQCEDLRKYLSSGILPAARAAEAERRKLIKSSIDMKTMNSSNTTSTPSDLPEQLQPPHASESPDAKPGQEEDWVSVPEGETLRMALAGADPSRSVLVSSNLRRAISTLLIAFRERLLKTNETVILHSALQEWSRNVDAQGLASANQIPPAPLRETQRGVLSDGGTLTDQYTKAVLDARFNGGTKTFESKLTKRLEEFAAWLFLYNRKDNKTSSNSSTTPASPTRPSLFIVAGHSAWFKHFFGMFIPVGHQHDARECKIVNGGVVQFTLQKIKDRETGVEDFLIPVESIRVVYGGFQKKVQFPPPVLP